MGVLGSLVEWAQATLGPYGVFGLIVLAFTEAVVSPIPPDALLPVLAQGESMGYALFLGLVTTAASVAGAILAYWIGVRFSPWVHERFAGPRLARVENWYQQHGEWVVAIAAFSPVPFKVFTLSSGLLGLRFWPFVLAATVGRALRFVPEALLAARYGEQVVAWIDANQIPALAVSLVLIALLYAWTRMRQGQTPEPDEAPPPGPGPPP